MSSRRWRLPQHRDDSPHSGHVSVLASRRKMKSPPMSTPNAPLSPLAAAIAKSRTCHCQLTADDIQRGVAEIRQLDKRSEKNRSRGCLFSVLGIAGTFGSFFVAAILNMPVLLLGSLASVVVVIWSIALNLLNRKTDFENRRYELVAKVTDLLGKDMSPDAQFDLALNLLPQDDKSKYVRDGKAGRWNVKHFHDPWLVLEGRLLDGTKFSVHMAEKHQARSCRKRGRSGKMKFKSKSKNSSEMTLYLKVKSEKYPQLATLGEAAQGAVQIPTWAAIKSLDVTAESLNLRVTTPTAWNVEPPPPPADAATDNKKPKLRSNTSADGSELVMSMFLSLYQILNLARAISKRQS